MLKNVAVKEDGIPFPTMSLVGLRRMSRSFLKKPDLETDLVEEAYRCPICGKVAIRRVKE